MKSLLLALLFLPAVVSAQPEWSTYCDNGVEKLRMMLIYHNLGAFGPFYGELHPYNNNECQDLGDDCGGYKQATLIEDLGGGEIRYVWEGWLRSCLTVETPAFFGQVWFYTQEPGQQPVLRHQDFDCYFFGEQTPVVDVVECSTLPVAARTWGAVKALYR